jgi:DNA-binding winged helix-turn-helix (wHTH) protein
VSLIASRNVDQGTARRPAEPLTLIGYVASGGSSHTSLLLACGKRAVVGMRLCALVERPGALVSKDVLIEAAWPGQAVEDSNLTVQIAALRRVLGEATPGGDRWIETMPRHGYRFIGPVVAEETPSPPVVKPKRNKAQLEKRERSEHSRSRMTPSHFAAGSSLMSGLGPSAMSALPPTATSNATYGMSDIEFASGSE